jgi:hypothetical protein
VPGEVGAVGVAVLLTQGQRVPQQTRRLVQVIQAKLEAAELMGEVRLNRARVCGLGRRQSLAQDVVPGLPPRGDEQDLLCDSRELDDGHPVLAFGSEVDDGQCCAHR